MSFTADSGVLKKHVTHLFSTKWLGNWLLDIVTGLNQLDWSVKRKEINKLPFSVLIGTKTLTAFKLDYFLSKYIEKIVIKFPPSNDIYLS